MKKNNLSLTEGIKDFDIIDVSDKSPQEQLHEYLFTFLPEDIPQADYPYDVLLQPLLDGELSGEELENLKNELTAQIFAPDPYDVTREPDKTFKPGESLLHDILDIKQILAFDKVIEHQNFEGGENLTEEITRAREIMGLNHKSIITEGKDDKVNKSLLAMFTTIMKIDEGFGNDLYDCVKNNAKVHGITLNPQVIMPNSPGLISPGKSTGAVKEQEEGTVCQTEAQEGINDCYDTHFNTETKTMGPGYQACHESVMVEFRACKKQL